jgi:hypothetical protein
VNQADRIMALNVPTHPIVQKPTFLVVETKVHGIGNTSHQPGGPTHNMQDWWLG